jgi:glycosyltransferase involved in cell wall biosynthesis
MSIGESERRKDPVDEKAKPIDRSDLGLVKKWSNYISYDPYFTPEMRDILYVDSQEVFSFKPNTKNVDSALGHVLIVSHDLSSSGAPKIVFDLARMLIDEGYAVIVASPSEGSFSSKLDEIGAGVIIDPVCFHGEWFREFARTFDRVICNTIVCWPLVASVARHTRLDWYVHESNLIDEILARSPDLLVALKSAHQILAGSRLTEERLFKIGIESHVLPYGIEPHAPSQLAERRMVVGVFGSFEPRKGQDLAVLGMLQLDKRVRRKVEMRLFGRTLDRDFRRAVADFASEDEAIVLRGELSIERYYAELNDVDVVLIPSRDDTLPLVSLDTLALGKVLICSSTTGTAEYLTPGVSGIVLDHNSPAEIAEVLDRLVSDPKLRVSLGKGAAVLFRKMFTVGAFQKRVRSVMNL